VKKRDVIQKNELYFCNQGFNVIQNQLSQSKHRLKSFVLQACVIEEFVHCLNNPLFLQQVESLKYFGNSGNVLVSQSQIVDILSR
jgi:hypothetical protein